MADGIFYSSYRSCEISKRDLMRERRHMKLTCRLVLQIALEQPLHNFGDLFKLIPWLVMSSQTA